MANSRWRKLNQFVAVSGIGKKQSALGEFLADADLDTRENCEIEMDLEIERAVERSCDGRDLVSEPVKRRLRRFRLTYQNPTAQQAFRMIAYKEGAVTAPVGTPANEVQTLTRSGTVSGGTFTLALEIEGRSGITKPISFNATPAQIQAAIIDQAKSLGKIIKPGDVSVAGNWGAGITITFLKRLAKANLPLLTLNNSLITGGGTITPAQTTAGDQNYHTAQRSADGSKPPFTIATGDSNGSVATRKYGDACVESVDFSLDTEQTNVQMTVVVLAGFNPEDSTNFTVPDCIKKPALRVDESRLKINGVFEHRDLVSHQISLNDNVPTGAAFVFDDVDISAPFVAGDEPTQNFTTEIFGDANHPLYELAENEIFEGNEVDFITNLGNPGNRVSVIAPETKIKPQSQLEGFSGEANQSTVKITGTPYGITDIPVRYEAFLDQSVAFLSE